MTDLVGISNSGSIGGRVLLRCVQHGRRIVPVALVGSTKENLEPGELIISVDALTARIEREA